MACNHREDCHETKKCLVGSCSDVFTGSSDRAGTGRGKRRSRDKHRTSSLFLLRASAGGCYSWDVCVLCTRRGCGYPVLQGPLVSSMGGTVVLGTGI